MNFLFDSVPEPAEVRHVCEGVRWCRMPLPFALDHVNCWLLGDKEPSVLVDTGVDNSLTRGLWQQVFAAIGVVPQQLFITHFHPDHIGLAGWFAGGCTDPLAAQANGQRVELTGSAVEVDMAHRIWQVSDATYAERYAQWYRMHGLPDDAVDTVAVSGNTYRARLSAPPAADRWRFVSDREVVQLAGRDYTVLCGRGHAPNMLMLYRAADRVLIAADQVLPHISPNVSVMPLQSDQNPLASFLDTLSMLRELPHDTLVLPSHGVPFRGLHARLDALEQHHAERLEHVLDACQSPTSAYDLFAILFRRRLDPQQTSFALGESLAHLHYLEQQGRIERSSDERGITRFRHVD